VRPSLNISFDMNHSLAAAESLFTHITLLKEKQVQMPTVVRENYNSHVKQVYIEYELPYNVAIFLVAVFISSQICKVTYTAI
jgi:hypothetical protein